MKKATTLLLVTAMLLFTIGCTSHVHKIGTGASTGSEESARQWYILFGAIPLNDVNAQEMAGDTQNYEIQTEQSFIDILIGGVAGMVTISSRTVTVKK